MPIHPPAQRPLLLTGFEPFGGYAVNPSAEAAIAVAAACPGRVVGVRLPVDYHAARGRLLATLDAVRPAACLCLGQAPSDEFRLEQHAHKPAQFNELPGEALLTGSWPWAGTEAALRGLGVRHRRSTDAGRYVCESTYWTLLDAVRRGDWAGPAGFVHVPAVSPAWPAGRTSGVVMAVVRDYLRSAASGAGIASVQSR